MARHSRGDDHHDGDVPEPRSASDLLREAGYDVPEQRSRRRRRDHTDEHTMPPVTERTMFPYRRDEARRERAAASAASAAAAEAARHETEFDPSTYPPSPWPQPPTGGSRTGATRMPQQAPQPQPARPAQQPQQRPAYPPPPNGGGTGATPYRQSPYQPDPRQPGPYPAPPSHLPHLASAQPASNAQARTQAPRQPVAPQPAQPVPSRPGQSRGAQARVTQAGEPGTQRSPWPAQRSAYPGVEQAPRPAAQPGPRWDPDHTGQTGPHTWPPVSRTALPELDAPTELAPHPAALPARQPKPALPPEYEDRPLDARGPGAPPAPSRGRPALPAPGGPDFPERPGRPLPITVPGARDLDTIDDAPPSRDTRGKKDKRRKGGRGSRDEIELARAEIAIEEDTSEFSSVAAIERRAERSDLIDPEPERSLLGAWVLFLVETVLAAGVGLSAWLGFHQLWRTQPMIAAGGCGLVLVGMHAIVGWVRKRQTGSPMDLFSSCVVVAVGVAITVLPAAFAINPTQ